MKTTILLILTIATTVAIQHGIDQFQSANSRETIAPTQVAQEPAHHQTIYAVGQVEGATQAVALRPKQSGFVKSIHVREGQFVEAGELLVQLDDAEQLARVAIAKAEITQAENELQRLLNGARVEEVDVATAKRDERLAELNQAKLKLARLAKLTSSGAVSQSDVDDAQATVNMRQAQVNAATADLRLIEKGTRNDEIQIQRTKVAVAQSRLRLEDHKLTKLQLRAPSSGQVLALDIEVGEPAGFDGKAILTLVDTRKLRVRAYVDELDACRLLAGQEATITADGLSNEQFTGQIVEVAPQMSRKRLFNDDPRERVDTTVREVVIEITSESNNLVVGLKVDVNLNQTPAVAPSEPLALK